MADSYLTSANVATFNKTDMDILVSDVLDDAPFLSVLAAMPVRGNTFSYTRLTANPSVGFRAVNDGIETTKSTYEKVTIDLGVLDASWAMDVAAAQVDERGVEHILAIEAMNHLRQAMVEVEEQILNGTNNIASNAFNGFGELISCAHPIRVVFVIADRMKVKHITYEYNVGYLVTFVRLLTELSIAFKSEWFVQVSDDQHILCIGRGWD